MAHAYASTVTDAELTVLLAELTVDLTYIYLETATECRWSRFDGAALPPGLLRGRAFGERCDVQFHREGQGLRLLALHESSHALSPPGDTLDLATFDTEEVTFVLWGMRGADADCWVEPGFPLRWHYPVEGAPRRVGVRSIEYRDRDTSDVQFVRYLDLVPMEGGT